MSFLIKDTTKEQRKKIVKNAFGVTISSNEMPSKEVIELTKKYINGEMELEDVQKKVIEMYRKR